MQEEEVPLFNEDCGEKIVHLLQPRERWAIEAAVAADRPLLVQGEPGVGKTQLAMAAAIKLNRPLISFTVDSRSESRDLLWTFDAVQRLAEAQVASAVCRSEDDLTALMKKIELANFVRPGPIWWALNWNSAEKHLGIGQTPPKKPEKDWSAKDSVVILIDEIDKADRDLPNGLLEVFGSRQFTPHGCTETVCRESGTKRPLMIVTTNRERSLPGAFLRRCLTLEMTLPPVLGDRGEELGKDAELAFIQYLTKRGRLHFPSAPPERLEKAARQIMDYRRTAERNQQLQKPGQAEFLDLLRAIHNLADRHDPDQVFDNVCELFRKPPEQMR